jgi:hypothetical protein
VESFYSFGYGNSDAETYTYATISAVGKASPDSPSPLDATALTDDFAAPHSCASPDATSRHADSYPNGDGHVDPDANCDSGMCARRVDAGCASNDRPLRRFHR